MNPGVDPSGAMKKLAALQKAQFEFASKILIDAGAYFLHYLTEEVLNGAYVNRITGMLVRSQTLTPIGVGVEIAANLSIAPYAPSVAARTLARYGKNYLNLAKFFTEEGIKEGAAREFTRMGETIDKNGNYRYTNPYR